MCVSPSEDGQVKGNNLNMNVGRDPWVTEVQILGGADGLTQVGWFSYQSRVGGEVPEVEFHPGVGDPGAGEAVVIGIRVGDPGERGAVGRVDYGLAGRGDVVHPLVATCALVPGSPEPAVTPLVGLAYPLACGGGVPETVLAFPGEVREFGHLVPDALARRLDGVGDVFEYYRVGCHRCSPPLSSGSRSYP